MDATTPQRDHITIDLTRHLLYSLARHREKIRVRIAVFSP
jgi:hypothetical protein